MKTKNLIRAILIIFFTLIISRNISANEKMFGMFERGYAGIITKEKLIKNIMKGEDIFGYVIKSDDLLWVINKTDKDIKI